MENNHEHGMDYRYFQNLWENPQPSPSLSSSKRWDERAADWIVRLENHPDYRKKELERVAATAAFLRQNGLLGPESAVLDIGCGPGLFASEFAKTAGHVTGLDISPRMLEHAAIYAQKQGLHNTDFCACNFKETDVDIKGWRKKFDMVMSCLTPAVTSIQDLHKIMEVSCGHCLHVSFIQSQDTLFEKVLKDLYPDRKKGMDHWDGRVFYSVFNLLFLEGYKPRTFYYEQNAEEDMVPDKMLAQRYAGYVKKDGIGKADESGRIYGYLKQLSEKKGRLVRHKKDCFGFILWDVNEKRTHKMSY